jgi:hypothetical protein
MLNRKLLQFLLIFIGLACSSVFAGQCEKHSSLFQTALIELYTSEGCSSCPPADKWIGKLIPKVLSADEVVPLVFHVDYWDRQGWRDRFANPAYTARQYANANISGSGFVFTPQVIVAGRNYQDWSNNSKVKKDIHVTHNKTPDASILLSQQAVASGKLEFEVQAQLRQGAKSNEVHIYAALFQNGLDSDVIRGGNSGSRLHHDYVVRNLLVSNAIDRSGKAVIRERFIIPADAQVKEMGIGVFVQDVKTGAVLQAMSAPLCVNGN